MTNIRNDFTDREEDDFPEYECDHDKDCDMSRKIGCPVLMRTYFPWYPKEEYRCKYYGNNKTEQTDDWSNK